MAGILTFALHYEGQINKNSQGAVSEAAKLSQQLGTECHAVVVGEGLAGTSVTAMLDPSTINTGDATRDGHLKSADFFDVEQFGQWLPVSTSVTPAARDWVLDGDLPIHYTRPM